MSDPPPSHPQESRGDRPGSESWRIGKWRADPSDLTLSCDGEEPRRLEPKGMALLTFLAERYPEVVGREEIFEHVWQGRAVVDGALSRAVSLLRQALGDDSRRPRYIETVPRRGYRLVADARRLPRSAPTRELESTHSALPPTSRAETASPTATSPAATPAEPTGAARPWATRWVRLLLPLLILGLVAGWWFRPSPSTPTADGPIRIAVLPLDSFGGEPGAAAEESYLSDGLTEELIHQLSGVSALGVVSRTSVTTAKEQGWTAPQIARQLNIDYLLEGSVLSAGKGLRITIQLIAPERDEHLWSRTYDRTLDDVFGLHREVALDVTTQVKAQLTEPEQSRLAPRERIDGEAYRLYLQGRQRIDRRTRANLRVALEQLQRSVELDPGLAAAWASLGKAHLLSELYLHVPQAQAYARAQDAVDVALNLDSGLAAAQVTLGQLLLLRDWDWGGAEAAYRTAIRRSPSHVLAHQWLSECLSLAGRHPEALESIHRAVDLDPLSPLVHAAWGQRLNAAGRHGEALERFKAADALGAQFAWHLREVAYAHERLGNVPAALEAHVERMSRRGVKGAEMEALRRAVAADGLRGYWSWQHGRLTAVSAAEPMLMAEALAGSGDSEKAWPWLRAAVAKRGSWFLHMVKSPAFDPIRDDPRFQAMVEKSRP